MGISFIITNGQMAAFTPKNNSDYRLACPVGKVLSLASTRYVKVKCILCLRKIKSCLDFDRHFVSCLQ